MTLVERAAQAMAEAHAGQVRKVGGTPYSVHPTVVALMLASHGFGEHVVAAALVHDVLEDTEYPEARLGQELGDEVLALVHAVTEDKSLAWEARKAAYVSSIAAAPAEAKAVSICDKIHNLQSIIDAHEVAGSAIWQQFTRGRGQQLALAEQLLQAYRRGWQHPLVEEYAELVERLRALA